MTAKFLAFVLRPLVGNTKRNVQNSFDFVNCFAGINPKSEETITSYDVEGLSTSIPTSSTIDVVHHELFEDTTLSNRTKLLC